MLRGASLGSATTDWVVAGTGDFNNDSFPHILWRNHKRTSGGLKGTSVIGGGRRVPQQALGRVAGT
jgi:hypothetical protein